jgi:hypothetical protein
METFKKGQEKQMEYYKKRHQRMGYMVWVEERNNVYIVHSELERQPYQWRPAHPDYYKAEKEGRLRRSKITGKNPRL